MMMDIKSALEDPRRRVIELSLQAAKKYLSPQTNLIHFCYENRYDARQDTIPIKENFAYALALLRTKTQENMLIAKELITKLLRFEINGNFPIYLHEFPHCRFPSQGVFCAPYFYWILKDYSAVLGSSLCSRLQEVLDQVKQMNPQGLNFGASVILEALTKGHLRALEKRRYHSEELVCILMALQLCSEKDKGCHDLLCEIANKWDETLCFYKQKPDLFWEKESLELTLLDLYMAELFNTYSDRMLIEHPVTMLASIIQPFSEELAMNVKPVYHAEPFDKPFLLLFGDKKKLHSLYIDTTASYIRCKEDAGLLQLEIGFEEAVDTMLDAKTELTLYINVSAVSSILVDKQKATVFRLGNTVCIETPHGPIKLNFSLKEGEGEWIGFLARGNRPHQKANKKEVLPTAFDHIIGLRTLRRSATACLQIECDIKALTSSWRIM